MKIVLLSGCSGWRLWPLSNEARSKQFLQLLQNEDGDYESMIQRIYRQICEAGMGEDVYVVTGGAQVDAIRSQIGWKAGIIEEPSRRDTFPAVAMAAAFWLMKNVSPGKKPYWCFRWIRMLITNTLKSFPAWMRLFFKIRRIFY